MVSLPLQEQKLVQQRLQLKKEQLAVLSATVTVQNTTPSIESVEFRSEYCDDESINNIV